jgi:hypothetical protein
MDASHTRSIAALLAAMISTPALSEIVDSGTGHPEHASEGDSRRGNDIGMADIVAFEGDQMSSLAAFGET